MYKIRRAINWSIALSSKNYLIYVHAHAPPEQHVGVPASQPLPYRNVRPNLTCTPTGAAKAAMAIMFSVGELLSPTENTREKCYSLIQ
jgi:glyceraldehyde-3-phosphate dehydrogenase/erythrose-4-phosphate dehydrogenase